MKKLTPEQEDALIEIGNIGMSKAAKQLSVLLNSTIKITIPKISVMSVEEVTKYSLLDHKQIYSLVSQKLGSDLVGCTALVFQREHANQLATAVIGKTPEFTQEEERACEQEALVEIGNIIITSCVSVIANMLSQTVQLSIPQYSEDKFLPLLEHLCLPLQASKKTLLVISTKLDAYNDRLSGFLFIILTEDSAAIMLSSIKKLLEG